VRCDSGRWLAALDSAATLPGRGAYVCRGPAAGGPSEDCLRLASRKGGLQRTLRRAVELPAELSAAVSVESESR
jgi:predicted RNA-binding protein YlxR (DUF448 family)